MQIRQLLCWAIALWLPSAVWAQLPDAGNRDKGVQDTHNQQFDFFESRIRPALVAHCYECHSNTAKIVQGGLLVDSRDALRHGGDSGAAIVPGKPAESLLLRALRHEGLEMPPKGRLPESLIRDFEHWILIGAPDPRDAIANRPPPGIDIDQGRRHWAFQPLGSPLLPVVQDANWPIDPLDHFLLAKLESVGLQPNAETDRYTWLRRVSIDLTGLPPTPEEIRAFVKDHSPQAFQSVVDRLLASRAFGERWARHWLDLTGYADMIGTSNNVFAEHAWRYRDYLIDAFRSDKPFDQFVLQQLAGDLLPASSPEQRAENLIATGFLMLGDVEIVEPDKAKMVADHVDSQVSKLGTVFMGLTLGCVRCHDHKFDPLVLADYYGIAGMFLSSPSTHKIPFGVWSSLNSTELPESPSQLAERLKLEDEHASRLANMKAEQSQLTEEKKKVVEEIAQLERRQSDTGSSSSTAVGSTVNLSADAAAVEPLVKRRDQLTEQLKNLASSIQHAEFFRSKVPRAFAMRDAEKPADMPIYIRGNPYAPGALIPRGVIGIATLDSQPTIPAGQSGRLQLAEWMIDNRHPLTARVAVNRIWQKLFGQGLVRSVDYFGLRGESPTHPELLDYLANRFMRLGWSPQQLIRSLVLSRAYRMSSANNAQAMQMDPDNRLLWRMNRQRLDAEAIRDGLLAVSGELQPSGGGPALVLERIENTGALMDKGVNPPNYTHRKPRPSQEFERTIYLPVLRTTYSGPDRVRNFFDFVDPAQISGQRNESVVALQSLFLMNNDLFRQRAATLAKQLLAETSETDARFDRLWLTVFNRPINAVERSDAGTFLEEFSKLLNEQPNADALIWTELCHSVLSSNEFIFRF